MARNRTIARRGAVGNYYNTQGDATLVEFALFDDFDVDEAAPVDTPRQSTLIVADTADALSIASSLLESAGGVAYNNPHVYFPIEAVATGKSLFARLKILNSSNNNGDFVGWTTTLNDDAGGFQNRATVQLLFNALRRGSGSTLGDSREINVISVTFVQPYTIDILIVLRAPGAFWFWRRGTVWELCHVNETLASANMYPRISAKITNTIDVDSIGVIYPDAMPDVLANDTLGTAMASTGVGDTGAAPHKNSIVTWRFTGATGVTHELMVRRVDDNNTLIIRASQSGSTLKLIEKVAGVETELSSVAQTITNATAYTFVINLHGPNIRVAQEETNRIIFGKAVGHDVTATGLKTITAATAVEAYPIEAGIGTIIAPGRAKAFLAWGDSITSGQGDTAPTSQNGYVGRYMATKGHEEIYRVSQGGYGVVLFRADSVWFNKLYTTVGIPDYIISHIGTNDVIASVVEATFKDDWRYLTRLMRHKFPNANVYIIKPWTNNVADANWLTFHDWLDDLMAEPEFSYCSEGANCRTLFSGAPATYLNVDNIHPNAAGHQLLADTLAANIP